MSLTLTKLSILLQILRIFSSIRRLTYAALGLILAYGISTMWANIFICYPVARFWDPRITEGYCLNRMRYWFGNASMNIVTDLVVWGLPMPVLRTLQIPRRQKIGVVGIFAVGVLSVASFPLPTTL